MITTPTIPTLTEPKLIDATIAEINGKLTTGLTWLDSAFGKAVRLEEKKDGRKRTFPAIYTGQKEYLKLIPDSHIGNFCFFDIEDGESLDRAQWKLRKTEVNFGLVFWFDYRDVYPADHQNRSIENVKDDIFTVLDAMRLKTGWFDYSEVFERKENVYKGYDTPKTNNQFWMRPYGCLRIEGVMQAKKFCP